MQPFEMVEQNMREALGCMARATPGAEVREMPGVLITNASVETPVFNAAFLSTPVRADPVELDRRIMIAKVYYQARGLPWSYWVCEDLVADEVRRRMNALFAKRGLRSVTECRGMIADGLAEEEQGSPRLDIRPVEDAGARLDFAHITSVCFRIPFQTSCAIYTGPATWETGFRAFNAYLGGRAVTTAATVFAAGAVGLYSVATIPEHQRRGFGEAITRHALKEARLRYGAHPIVLQATAQGIGLYRRLGFQEVTRIRVYVSR